MWQYVYIFQIQFILTVTIISQHYSVITIFSFFCCLKVKRDELQDGAAPWRGLSLLVLLRLKYRLQHCRPVRLKCRERERERERERGDSNRYVCDSGSTLATCFLFSPSLTHPLSLSLPLSLSSLPLTLLPLFPPLSPLSLSHSFPPSLPPFLHSSHLEAAVGFRCSLGGSHNAEIKGTSSENLCMFGPGEEARTSASVEGV